MKYLQDVALSVVRLFRVVTINHTMVLPRKIGQPNIRFLGHAQIDARLLCCTNK